MLGPTVDTCFASVCGFVLSAMLGSTEDTRFASVHAFGVDIVSRPGIRQSLVRCLPRLTHENMWIFWEMASRNVSAFGAQLSPTMDTRSASGDGGCGVSPFFYVKVDLSY